MPFAIISCLVTTDAISDSLLAAFHSNNHAVLPCSRYFLTSFSGLFQPVTAPFPRNLVGLLRVVLLLSRSQEGLNPLLHAPAGPAREAARRKLRDGAGWVHNTTIFGPESSWVDRHVGVLVNAEADPGEQAVLNLVAHEGVADDRVVAVGARPEEEVVLVGHNSHRVGVVGRRRLRLGDEFLVKVDLANMRRTAARDRVVRLLGGAKVDNSCSDTLVFPCSPSFR